MRRGLAWALTLPLVLLGTQAAHALAYDLVYPEAHGRILLQTGHGYLTWLPLTLALAGAVALAALCVAAADAARGRPPRELPGWAFALLPPVTFVIQELLELSLHTGTFGWRALLAPTFLPGIALQLPVAVAAFLVARLLLRTAEHVGRAEIEPEARGIEHHFRERGHILESEVQSLAGNGMDAVRRIAHERKSRPYIVAREMKTQGVGPARPFEFERP